MSKIDIPKLKLLYIDQGLNMVETAAELGVSPPTVRVTLIKLGIPTRRLPLAPFEEIRRLYVDEHWALRRIARKFGISHQAVSKRLRDKGIILRPSGSFNDPLLKRPYQLVKASMDVEELVRLYRDERVPLYLLARQLNLSFFMIRTILTSEGIRIRVRMETQAKMYAPILALEIGEATTFHLPEVRFPIQAFHAFAKHRQMSVKVKTLGDGRFCVTRVS